MKRLKALTLFLLCILALTGCSTHTENNTENAKNTSTQTEGTSHYPVTITTYNYKKEPIEVTFEKAPEKVFAVYQDSIETLLALGLEDKIVAAAGLDQDVKGSYKAGFDKINYLTEFTPDKESVICSNGFHSKLVLILQREEFRRCGLLASKWHPDIHDAEFRLCTAAYLRK